MSVPVLGPHLDVATAERRAERRELGVDLVRFDSKAAVTATSGIPSHHAGHEPAKRFALRALRMVMQFMASFYTALQRPSSRVSLGRPATPGPCGGPRDRSRRTGRTATPPGATPRRATPAKHGSGRSAASAWLRCRPPCPQPHSNRPTAARYGLGPGRPRMVVGTRGTDAPSTETPCHTRDRSSSEYPRGRRLGAPPPLHRAGREHESRRHVVAARVVRCRAS